jgi:RNA binding exosome subunit
MGTTQIAMKSRGSLGNTLETYSSKLENLEEMNKFLAAVHQPKLSREDIKHLH